VDCRGYGLQVRAGRSVGQMKIAVENAVSVCSEEITLILTLALTITIVLENGFAEQPRDPPALEIVSQQTMLPHIYSVVEVTMFMYDSSHIRIRQKYFVSKLVDHFHQ